MILIDGVSSPLDIEKRDQKKREQLEVVNEDLRDNIKFLPEDMVLKNGTIKDDIVNFAQKYSNCSTNELIAQYNHSGKTLRKKLHSNACNEVRFCKICAGRKTAQRWNRLKPKIEELHSLFPHIYLMTFTQKTHQDLYLAIEQMQQKFRRWYKLADHNRSGEYSKVKAGIKSLEVVRGERSGEWHVHIHFLAFCSSAIDFKKWKDRRVKNIFGELVDNENPEPLHETKIIDGKEWVFSKFSLEWYKATGDLMADCKPIRPNKKYGGKGRLLEGAVKEVLKYNTKVSHYSPKDLALVYDATRGVRHFELTGLLRDYNEDLIKIEKIEKTKRKDFKTKLKQDSLTKKLYEKRVLTAQFMHLRFNTASKCYDAFNTKTSSWKNLMHFPELVQIYQRVKGEIVAAYNSEVWELRRYIGSIPNKEFIAIKKHLKHRLLSFMKHLHNTISFCTDELTLKKRLEGLYYSF
jgi:hypothetical protein